VPIYRHSIFADPVSCTSAMMVVLQWYYLLG
jgi:hypothetical protein